MKGGPIFLAYEITVFLGSIPFITFLTWRARILGLNKRSAFFVTVYLSGNVMLFPWALRLGWINWWILSIIILFISSILWSKVPINKTVDNVSASEINGNAVNNNLKEISELSVPLPLVEVGIPRLQDPIDELINLGFEAKQSENFEQAATYFSHALAQDPVPDLAFSLITDCYWLWDNLGKRDYALTQLQTNVQKYLPLFDVELRLQFETWIVKEDLQRNFK